MRRWAPPGWNGSPAPDPPPSQDGCTRCGAGGTLHGASVVPHHKGGRKGPRNRQWLCRHCLRMKRMEDR